MTGQPAELGQKFFAPSASGNNRLENYFQDIITTKDVIFN